RFRLLGISFALSQEACHVDRSACRPHSSLARRTALVAAQSRMGLRTVRFDRRAAGGGAGDGAAGPSPAVGETEKLRSTANAGHPGEIQGARRRAASVAS